MPTRRNAKSRTRKPRGILIWVYGSNLDPDQMAERCPDARIICTAYLPEYRLEFRGHSYGWGGAVATVSQARGHSVPGVLYRCSPADVASLDRHEGHPAIYRRRRVTVTAEGRRRRVQAYIMQPGPETRAPSAAYFRAIYRGYLVWDLPVRILTQAVKHGRRRYRKPRSKRAA